MRILLMVTILVAGFGFQAANATMRALTPQEQAATCYPSSPLLHSDACWGQPYMGNGQHDIYRGQQGDPFSELYAIMNALQGQGAMGSGNPMMGLGLDASMLWQNSSMMGQSPMMNFSSPIVK